MGCLCSPFRLHVSHLCYSLHYISGPERILVCDQHQLPCLDNHGSPDGSAHGAGNQNLCQDRVAPIRPKRSEPMLCLDTTDLRDLAGHRLDEPRVVPRISVVGL